MRLRNTPSGLSPANQMMAAQIAFYSIHKDFAIIAATERRIAELKESLKELQGESNLGIVNDEQITAMESKITDHHRDLTALKDLFRQEVALFAHSMGFHAISDMPLTLAGLDLPDPRKLRFFDPADFVKDAQDRSLEVWAMRELRAAADAHAKDLKFSFLYPGSGIQFDFTYYPNRAIATSLGLEVDEKTAEAKSMIEVKCVEISSKFNSNLKDYRDLRRDLEVDKEKLARLLLPSYFSVNSIQERETLNDLLFENEIKMTSVAHDLLVNRAAYDRLTLTGVYERLRTEPFIANPRVW